MHSLAGVAFACAFCASAANYTTYIGDTYAYQVAAITTDASGNTYVTGSRQIGDVFVSKIDASGNLSLIATFSGKGVDQASAIALDPSGNIYIVGSTTSLDFPLHNPLQAVSDGSQGTGFLVKMTSDGTVLYSTYLGGTMGQSYLSAVAADSSGNAYVTGTTVASDYQHTPGLPAPIVTSGPAGGAMYGAFFAKISPAGDQIVYAGALSATQRNCTCCSSCDLSELGTDGVGIAVDSEGNAYIAGNTNGLSLPTTPNALLAAGVGAFVAKVNAAGTGFAYLTYVGGGSYSPDPGGPYAQPANYVFAIAVDAQGNAYLSGSTSDLNFPATPSAYQPKLDVPDPANINGFTYPPPPSDAFVAKLNPTGTAMVWATFLGGSQSDAARTIAVDPSGNVWVSGTTVSADFPHTFAWPNGGEFLSELDVTGSKLLYSAILPGNVAAAGLAVDSSGSVHFAGYSGVISAATPGSAPGQSSATSILGIADAQGGLMGGRFAPGELISIYGLNLGPTMPITATFDAAGFLPTTLGGIQVMINGIAAPLLSVSGTQIKAVTPVELKVGATNLGVVWNGTNIPDFRAEVDVADPQVLVNPDNSTVAINQDGTVNSAANPAKVGSYVSVWATGIGYTSGGDGQKITAADAFCGNCEIIIGYLADGPIPISLANVSYAGAAPGLVNGVIQINFQVANAMQYALSINGAKSNFFGIYVQP